MNTEFTEKMKIKQEEKVKVEEFLDRNENLQIDSKTTTDTPPIRVLGFKRTSNVELVCHFFPCMKTFKSRENLDLHILNIHLKMKPFECEYCDKKFSHRNGKNYHERTKHLNILPFKCNYEDCDKKYASKSALSFHEQSKHFK